MCLRSCHCHKKENAHICIWVLVLKEKNIPLQNEFYFKLSREHKGVFFAAQRSEISNGIFQFSAFGLSLCSSKRINYVLCLIVIFYIFFDFWLHNVNMTTKISLIFPNGKICSGGRDCSFCFKNKYLVLVVVFRFYVCKACANNSESWKTWDAAEKTNLNELVKELSAQIHEDGLHTQWLPRLIWLHKFFGILSCLSDIFIVLFDKPGLDVKWFLRVHKNRKYVVLLPFLTQINGSVFCSVEGSGRRWNLPRGSHNTQVELWHGGVHPLAPVTAELIPVSVSVACSAHICRDGKLGPPYDLHHRQSKAPACTDLLPWKNLWDVTVSQTRFCCRRICSSFHSRVFTWGATGSKTLVN